MWLFRFSIASLIATIHFLTVPSPVSSVATISTTYISSHTVPTATATTLLPPLSTILTLLPPPFLTCNTIKNRLFVNIYKIPTIQQY